MRAALVIAMVWTTACGGDDGSGFGLGNVDIEDAPDAIRSALCHHAAMCGLFPDEATCLAANTGLNVRIDPGLIAAVKAGKIRYDGRALGDCYEAFGDASCDRTDADGRTFAQECANAITGTVAGGGQCALDEECISQDCSVPQCPDACCQGTCVGDTPPVRIAQIGQPCETSNGCAVGSWCDTSTSLCASLEPADSPCTSPSQCDYGLGCAGTPRTCRVLPVVGEACPDLMCRDEGTYCEATAQICTRYALPGEACSTTVRCSTYYECDPGSMQCVRGAAIGEACTSSSDCADFGTYCKANVCAPLEVNGAPCMDDNDCDSDNCDPMGGVCSDQPVCF